MGKLIELRTFNITDFNFIFEIFKNSVKTDYTDKELNTKIKNRLSNLAKCWIFEDNESRVGFIITNLIRHFAFKKPFLQVDWLYLHENYINNDTISHIQNHLAMTIKEHDLEKIVITESAIINPVLKKFMQNQILIKPLDLIYSMEVEHGVS